MRKISNEELRRPSAEEFAAARKMAVTVVLDNVRSALNVGSFFRTCDAFAAERIMLCGITAAPPDREIHKTALGAELTVAWERRASTLECVEQLHEEGYTVLAIEQVEGAAMLQNLDRADLFAEQNGKKYALVFGNEVEGVDQRVADMCDGAIEIPQVGTKHSLNVSVAGGVVLWEFFKYYLAQE